MKAGQGLTKPYFFYLHLTLLLSCSFSTALIPTARLSISCGRTAGLASWSNTSRMTRRRAAGQEPAPASFDRDEDTDGTRSRGGMGMLFWRDKMKTRSDASSDRENSTSSTSSSARRWTGASSFSAAASAACSAARSDSVIHLGKLRIPESRRIHHISRRVAGDAGQAFATSDEPLLQVVDDDITLPLGIDGEPGVEDDKNKEDRREGERKIVVDAERITMTHSFVGEPSLIPYGMGQDQTQRGVVQIPLHYSVRQTVDFVRAVFTRDRQEYPSSLEASSLGGRGKGSQEGGLLQADTRTPAALTDRIYVTKDGKLEGYITMTSLLTNDPTTPVLSLVRELEELLREGDSWEQAAHRLRHANVLAAPVVDSEGVLVAVLNPSDLLNEMEIEATDDIMRQSGSGGGESYFGTPLVRLVASRVGWLVGLLGLQSFSSLILQSYQSVIERNIVIALFLTMLTGTAGNAGNQSSAIVIRGLATGEIHEGNRFKVIWREARAAVASAVVLSIASFVRVSLTPGATTVATLAVAIAMGTTVVGAVMFGTIAPIVLDGMGVDPVNFASPALATLTDVSGVFILCCVAKLMLGSGS